MHVIQQLASDLTIDVIYFDRTTSNTGLSLFIRDVADEALYLDPFDLVASKSVIASANIDVLLYLALPTEKFTFLLAQSRWAVLFIQITAPSMLLMQREYVFSLQVSSCSSSVWSRPPIFIGNSIDRLLGRFQQHADGLVV